MTVLTRPTTRAAAGTLALAVSLAAGTALAGPASAAAGFAFDQRIGGADRVATAVLASQRAYPDPAASAHAVVLANKDRTVDGLTASYVAGLHDAPILYTEVETTPSGTKAEMARLGVRTVYVVGGTSVVSAAQEAALRSTGTTVTRYGGTDRYDTAALAASSGSGEPARVFIASGERPADALVAGPLAFAKHYPVLLTRPGDVPARTREVLAGWRAADRTVIGGEAVVTASTYAALGATQRLAGADRQGTAVKVAQDAIASEGFSSSDLGLVGGQDRNTVDALVAASVAGKGVAGRGGVPLLFVQGDAVGATTDNYLRAHSTDLTGTGYVFGGPSAVSQKAANAATAAADRAVRPSLAVSPTQLATLAPGTERTYTVSGLDDSAAYEVALFPSNAVDFFPDGSVLFEDANGDSTADALGSADAVISSVGGSSGGTTTSVAGVRPSGGRLTFTVSSSVADQVNPVVFADADEDGKLDLQVPAVADRRAKGASEAFGAGGQTDWS